MKDLCTLAMEAKHHNEMLGRTIDAFIVPLEKWNRAIASEHHLVPDPEGCRVNKIIGIPVEVRPSLLSCVHRSITLNEEGKLGWLLNPDPFAGVVFEKADGGDG